MKYDRTPQDFEDFWNVMRVKFWLDGKSFAELDEMSIEDISMVLGYLSEKHKAEKK